MTACGKPVRLLGKVASGNFTRCTRMLGHTGECTDGSTHEEGSRQQTGTIVAPTPEWPFKTQQPEIVDEQAGDSSLPPIQTEFPDGVVIQ